MSKPKGNTTLADMSLPPEERAKGRKPGITRTPPAQMDHGTSPRARRQRRDGERWLARAAAARDDTGHVMLFPDDCLISDESEWRNLEMARRSLGQEAGREDL